MELSLMATAKKVKADEILHALSKRHWEDFFTTEVRDGPSYMRYVIMDALAIKKSWKNPCFTGYEIKVSRSDFVRDTKWPAYLDMCHEFYFVCPKGMIQPEELPNEVGLLWFNTESKSFYTKRKAQYRKIEIPNNVLMCIIMSHLSPDRHPFYSSTREFFEGWLEYKRTSDELGYQVRSEIVKRMAKIENENRRLKYDLKTYEEQEEILEKTKEVLFKHGAGWFFKSQMPDVIDEMLKQKTTKLSDKMLQELQNAKQSIEMVIENMKR